MGSFGRVSSIGDADRCACGDRRTEVLVSSSDPRVAESLLLSDVHRSDAREQRSTCPNRCTSAQPGHFRTDPRPRPQFGTLPIVHRKCHRNLLRRQLFTGTYVCVWTSERFLFSCLFMKIMCLCCIRNACTGVKASLHMSVISDPVSHDTLHVHIVLQRNCCNFL